MARGIVTVTALFGGFALGIAAGYHISRSLVLVTPNVFILATAAQSAPAFDAPPFFSERAKIDSVDAVHQVVVIDMPNPYTGKGVVTISATYDKKTVFWGATGNSADSSELRPGESMAIELARTGGPLYLNSVTLVNS